MYVSVIFSSSDVAGSSVCSVDDADVYTLDQCKDITWFLMKWNHSVSMVNSCCSTSAGIKVCR